METRKAKTRTVAMVVLCVCGILVYALIATGGSLEPSAPPAPTMKTLDEIYNKPVWRMLDKEFIDWPGNPRFAVCDNGTPADESDDMVLDKETGLIWTRDANPVNGTSEWQEAVYYCRRLNLGNRRAWRLPTVEEMSSLLYHSLHGNFPSLPIGHPFINVPTPTGEDSIYWTGTTFEINSDSAWTVLLFNGWTSTQLKTRDIFYVWPVRGGNGYASGNW